MAKAKAKKASSAKKAKKSVAKKSAGGVAALQSTASTRRILNCIPSPDQQQDWSFDNALTAGIADAAGPPKSRDLRETWWKVGDQGQTGACVGWATADSVLRWHFVKAGRLGQNEVLSPRFIWMASKESDEFTTAPTTFIESEGTSLKSALDVARKFGSVTDAELPFLSGQLYQGEARTFYATASMRKIANYINLGRDLKTWRAWLANNGPILTRLDVDSTWDNAKQTQGKLTTYNAGTKRGGHAVALVGYDETMFIVRNSWGTDTWGDKGFGYASNDYTANAFTEAYGVTIT